MLKSKWKVQNITAGELKIWQQKYTNFFHMSGVHVFVALKSWWEHNCSHTLDKKAALTGRRKQNQWFMPLQSHNEILFICETAPFCASTITSFEPSLQRGQLQVSNL